MSFRCKTYLKDWRKQNKAEKNFQVTRIMEKGLGVEKQGSVEIYREKKFDRRLDSSQPKLMLKKNVEYKESLQVKSVGEQQEAVSTFIQYTIAGALFSVAGAIIGFF